jgi:hypothetical protein
MNLIMTNTGITTVRSFFKNCTFILASEEIAQKVKSVLQMYPSNLFASQPPRNMFATST